MYLLIRLWEEFRRSLLKRSINSLFEFYNSEAFELSIFALILINHSDYDQEIFR